VTLTTHFAEFVCSWQARTTRLPNGYARSEAELVCSVQGHGTKKKGGRSRPEGFERRGGNLGKIGLSRPLSDLSF
jgi:hypothetical protein